MRLNAWARLGILVTILWIAAAGYTRFREATDLAATRSTAQFQACSLAVQAKGGGDYKPCFEAVQNAEEASRFDLWTGVAIGALAPAAIAWVIFFLGAGAARWVLAGRRES